MRPLFKFSLLRIRNGLAVRIMNKGNLGYVAVTELGDSVCQALFNSPEDYQNYIILKYKKI